jgi:four helix bundle protein
VKEYAMIASHRELLVWQKAMDLVVQVYALTKTYPHAEQYALTAQTTRAAVSVVTNIAEGHARSTRKDYAQYLSISRGSLMEAETLVTIAERLGYVSRNDVADVEDRIIEISKMLTALRRRILEPPPPA